MKKCISILALLAVVATGAFAQGFPLSMAAGGGALFDYSFGNGLKGNFNMMGYSGGIELGISNLSIGGFGFFDATYAEADVYFAYGMTTMKFTGTGFLAGVGADPYDGNQLQLGFTLLGKYPFDLGGFTLFPLLGIDYNLVLKDWDKDGSADKPSEMNQFGILAGGGLDFPFSDNLFFRAEVLFHLRFPYSGMNELEGFSGYDMSLDKTYGLGPRIKIGVGYRFGGGSGSTGSSSSSRSGRYMLVNADTLNVRSQPNADSSLVGTLPRNTRVEVLNSSGTWWEIRSGNIRGYVNSSYLKAE